MGDQQTKAPEAPGADTAPAQTGEPKSGRAKRYTFYKDGKDYVLLSVQRDEQGNPVPNGGLSAIPDVPRFESAQEAKRWVQASGEKLQGLTVLVVRMMHRLSVLVENTPRISVTEEKRHQRTGATG